MNNICFLFLVGILFFTTSANATLIYSEYVEGSSFNKAIELFNSGDEINFDADSYAVEIYSNGASTASSTINLSGVLGQNMTFVIGHSRSSGSIQSAANQLSGSLNFNGDDAIVLTHNGMIVDRIGQPGFDPGSEWGSGLTSTQNNTLRRLPGILSGDNTAFANFEPTLQWAGFALDSFDGLGQHQINLPVSKVDQVASVPEPSSLWLLLLGMLGFLKSGRPGLLRPSFS
ncbi:lamin tail domain-containing protein [Kaarinaea lacus]